MNVSPGPAKLTTNRSSKVPIPRRGHVVHVVGGLVGDHREVRVEVLPRAPRLLYGVRLLVEPQQAVAVEFADDLLKLRLGEVSERVRARDDLVHLPGVDVALVHHDPDDLVRDRV